MSRLAILANIDSTRANRRAGIKDRKYPWRMKRFYPVSWTAQAVKYDGGKLTLPMGRGRKPLSFKLDLDFVPGATSLVWNHRKIIFNQTGDRPKTPKML